MHSSIRGSVRGFARDLVDFAGLFPPAELPLDAALARYLTHRTTDDAWMLARFLIPVARLDALVAWLDRENAHAGTPVHPLRLGILAGAATDEAEWGRVLVSSFDAMAQVAERRDLRIEALEIKLPPSPPAFASATANGWDGWIRAALDVRDARGFDIPLYFEAGLGENLDEWPGAVFDALARTGGRYKIRMGGVTAAQVPGIDAVAFAIERLCDLQLPWKATAGLHHPIRRWDPTLGAWTHGFVNLFGAALLAACHALRRTQIAEILAEQDPTAFVFGEEQFGWRTFTLSIAELDSLRTRFATSFGSCSFAEPCEDLRALGLL